MKCLVIRISVLLFLTVSSLSFAGWQVANPPSASSNEPFFQAGMPQNPTVSQMNNNGSFPDQFSSLGKPSAMYAISVSGSLKENIERIMDRYHWKVIWKAPYDYNFDGRVTGTSLPNVIEKLLSPFPLQATLYMSNRTMTIIPRKVIR